MNKDKLYIFAVAVFFAATLSLLSGCSTPQERSGVSPIPFNSQERGENRSFGGSF